MMIGKQASGVMQVHAIESRASCMAALADGIPRIIQNKKRLTTNAKPTSDSSVAAVQLM